MKKLALPMLIALPVLLGAAPAAAREIAGARASGPAVPLSRDRLARPASQTSFDNVGPTSAQLGIVTDFDLGIGLYSVGGHFVRDRETNGREPIVGTLGKQNKVAAVGLSLRF